ncbi:transposase, partial [Phenylobacterium sp.]|uniref:transposase n=1 Tax=Phenylobacterium sp. TaxID=1871053 RepID=UPI00345BF023
MNPRLSGLSARRQQRGRPRSRNGPLPNRRPAQRTAIPEIHPPDLHIAEAKARSSQGRGRQRRREGHGKRRRAFGHWKTLTFIAALRCDRMEAPFVLDGPINGQAFRLYVETQRAPTLRPGDVVVMDNLGSHKGKAARAAIRSRGAHL